MYIAVRALIWTFTKKLFLLTASVTFASTLSEAAVLNIVEVTNRHLLKEYIHFPYRLYRNYSHYVPPLFSDEWEFHNPKKNLYLKKDEHIRLLITENGRTVGRIMGIIPALFNSGKEIKHCRFFHFDCEDRLDVAQCMIATIEQWGRSHGMHQLTGPFGFSDKDPQGLQIEGFEHLPVIAAPCNPPYLPQLLYRLGFEKEVDCVSYCIPVPETIPEVYQTIAQRCLKNRNLQVARISNRWQLRKYIYPVLELVNASFRNIYGFNVMSQEEMKNLAFKFLLFLDPRFCIIVTDKEKRPIGFMVGIPDISPGLQKACGRLFPLGIFHIYRARKQSRQLDLLLGGVHPDYQGQGITAILAVEILKAAIHYGMKTLDSHLNLETNVMMNREMQRAGGHIYKRFRIFKKSLV